MAEPDVLFDADAFQQASGEASSSSSCIVHGGSSAALQSDSTRFYSALSIVQEASQPLPPRDGQPAWTFRPPPARPPGVMLADASVQTMPQALNSKANNRFSHGSSAYSSQIEVPVRRFAIRCRAGLCAAQQRYVHVHVWYT